MTPPIAKGTAEFFRRFAFIDTKRVHHIALGCLLVAQQPQFGNHPRQRAHSISPTTIPEQINLIPLAIAAGLLGVGIADGMVNPHARGHNEEFP